MLTEAASMARFGAVLVDGERNPFALVMVVALGTLLGRGSLPFWHDSVTSIRRMYTEQELSLMGRLAPPRDDGRNLHLEGGWLFPGHVWLGAD